MTATLSQPLTATTAPRESRRSRRAELALILGVPVAWALLLLAHPTGDTTIYDAVHDRLTAWQAVHLGMMAFIPLMALAVHRLLRGIDNTAARISRWALPVFVVTYGAFEAIMGLGTGMLVSSIDTATHAERVDIVQEFADSPVIAVVENLASLACGVALVAAAFALQRARLIGGKGVTALLLATPLIAMHVPPFGPVGLALFVIVASAALRRAGRLGRSDSLRGRR